MGLNDFLLSLDLNSDKIDDGVRLMAMGGNGFKLMVKPLVLKGVYR